MAKKKRKSAACIISGLLYLGPVSVTSNKEYLETEGITHILSIGKSPPQKFDSISYHRLGLLDDEGADIKPVIEKACEIVDDAMKRNERVLVHCSAAISRSPTVVTGYLIGRRGMMLRESLKVLVEGREVVQPNPGFLRQLAEMEREVFGEVTVKAEELEGKKLRECL
ncbi:phosphatases II [Zopfia rhizophila CBS 207.26]|uniref:protein-tyrosine-phosphatase n=1 Tax=Zopfia rhizophila CBS 207.26 TaxID=1314779 RepID=A0A6A6EK12_9PEZI|nr:phosphatases II [Zopfia rhizophila CBS 207.26]